MPSAFSKIWIVVIVVIIIVIITFFIGGILIWQYFLVSKGEIEITQLEKKEDQPVETVPQPEKLITLLIEKTELGEEIAIIENGKKDSWVEASWMVSPDEKKIIWKGHCAKEGFFAPTQLFVAKIVEKLNKEAFLIKEKTLLLKVPDDRFGVEGVFITLHQWSKDGIHFYLRLHGEDFGGFLRSQYIKINVNTGEITEIIANGHLLDISSDERKFAFFVLPTNSVVIKDLDGTDKVFPIIEEYEILRGYFSPNEKYLAGCLEIPFPDPETHVYSEIVIFDLEKDTMKTIMRYPAREYILEGWLTNEKLKLSKERVMYSINRDGSGLTPF